MDRPRFFSFDAERVPRYLTVLSVGLGLVLLVEIANQIANLGDLSTVSFETLPWAYVTSFLLSVPFVVGIGYGARYLSTEPFPPERNPRVFKWCLVGVVVWIVINLLTLASFGVFSFWPVVGWIRGAVAWGGAFGLLIGFVEARAITNAVSVEQERLRARHLSETRETIDYLNGMLRHEVLNSVTVIQGHGRLLAEELPETDDRYVHVEPILRRSEDIESVVKGVRTMMESVHHEPDLERVSLGELLTEEVEMVRDMEPDVEVSMTVPEQVFVSADDMLGRVFGNLLANAVEHNDSDTPRITVSVDPAEETVTVRISDNGPGIDPGAKAALFERPDVGSCDHGFGLYMVGQLCERYGGSIEVTETGDDGTTFAVTLPRVDAGCSPTSPEPIAATHPERSAK